jgi:hypothetical protein
LDWGNAVGNVTSAALEFSKDNMQFGVRPAGTAGNRSRSPSLKSPQPNGIAARRLTS